MSHALVLDLSAVRVRVGGGGLAAIYPGEQRRKPMTDTGHVRASYSRAIEADHARLRALWLGDAPSEASPDPAIVEPTDVILSLYAGIDGAGHPSPAWWHVANLLRK